jgi:hypothetical protein
MNGPQLPFVGRAAKVGKEPKVHFEFC